MVQLPSLSVSSDQWFSVGRWEITWIHKFSIAFERTTQQTESTRISVTRQLMLPVIDVIHNSCTLYYSALYSCINHGYTACFLCYFSSQMPQRVASIVNGIYGSSWIFAYWRRVSFPVMSTCSRIGFLFVTARCQSPSLSCGGGRWGFHVLPMLGQLHSFLEEHVCICPFSSVPFYGESVRVPLLRTLRAVASALGAWLTSAILFTTQLKTVPEGGIRAICSLRIFLQQFSNSFLLF